MFESKSEILHGDFECEDIAGRLYLWKPKMHTPDHPHMPKRLIISAHGLRRTCHMFTIKRKVTLNFYSQDKNSVLDPGLRKFYEGKAIPAETLKQGSNCYNYILSKYTNSSRNSSHNKNGESYQTLNKLMQRDYEKSGRDLLGEASWAFQHNKISAELYESNRIEAIKQIALKPAAVLTIRNRRFKADVNLEWVLDVLHAKGYRFNVIDCLFCRNTLITSIKDSLPFFGDYSDGVVFAK